MNTDEETIKNTEIEEAEIKDKKVSKKKKNDTKKSIIDNTENSSKSELKAKLNSLVHPSRLSTKKVHKLKLSVIKKRTKTRYNQFI